MEMQVLKIGQPFTGNIGEHEGAKINWWSNGCEIIFAIENPTPLEIEAFGKGTFELALSVVNNMPFISFQVYDPCKGFGDGTTTRLAIPWQEMPMHISKIDPMYLPNIDKQRDNPQMRLLITCVLIDYDTKVIFQLRAFTVSPAFVNKMFEALITTAEYYTFSSYAEGVNKVFGLYEVGEIAKKALITCLSGS
jgi:hypothetical protein